MTTTHDVSARLAAETFGRIQFHDFFISFAVWTGASAVASTYVA